MSLKCKFALFLLSEAKGQINNKGQDIKIILINVAVTFLLSESEKIHHHPLADQDLELDEGGVQEIESDHIVLNLIKSIS